MISFGLSNLRIASSRRLLARLTAPSFVPGRLGGEVNSMSEQVESPPQADLTFARLAFGAALVTFLMIVIGAITRVTESGMGCGTYWPSCNGRLVPEFENTAVVIEFGHRVFALLVGAFALAVFVQAWRRHRGEPRLLYPAVVGIVLYFVQSGLGAITVALNNQWVSVLLHLGNSMFLLAVYLVAWSNARSKALVADGAGVAPALPFLEATLATALTLLAAMVGAAVAGNNATKACVGWPLCGGQIWPAEQGPLQMLNMLHRLIVGALASADHRAGVGRAARRPTRLRQAAGTFGLFLVQAAQAPGGFGKRP
jgi:heme A synthase